MSLDKNKLKPNKQVKISTFRSRKIFYISLITTVTYLCVLIICYDELIKRTAHFDPFNALLL